MDFSPEDRKELLKQGLILDNLVHEVHDLKAQIRDSNAKREALKDTIDDRVTLLETTKQVLAAQVKAIMWIGGIIITVLQFTMQLWFYSLRK